MKNNKRKLLRDYFTSIQSIEDEKFLKAAIDGNTDEIKKRLSAGVSDELRGDAIGLTAIHGYDGVHTSYFNHLETYSVLRRDRDCQKNGL